MQVLNTWLLIFILFENMLPIVILVLNLYLKKINSLIFSRSPSLQLNLLLYGISSLFLNPHWAWGSVSVLNPISTKNMASQQPRKTPHCMTWYHRIMTAVYHTQNQNFMKRPFLSLYGLRPSFGLSFLVQLTASPVYIIPKCVVCVRVECVQK